MKLLRAFVYLMNKSIIIIIIITIILYILDILINYRYRYRYCYTLRNLFWLLQASQY